MNLFANSTERFIKMLNAQFGLEELDKNRCVALLDRKPIRKKLTELFEIYYNGVVAILNIATVESKGIRPTGITNEIFSCFHHIARGLSSISQSNNDSEIEQTIITEVESAKRHLRRAQLDCYKIAINSYLSEQNELKDTLAFLRLAEDLENVIKNGFEIIDTINNLESQIKNTCLEAKNQECAGNFDTAINHFEETLSLCYDQRVEIKKFTENKAYLAQLKKQARERNDKEKSNRTLIIAAIIGVVGVLLGVLLDFILL